MQALRGDVTHMTAKAKGKLEAKCLHKEKLTRFRVSKKSMVWYLVAGFIHNHVLLDYFNECLGP